MMNQQQTKIAPPRLRNVFTRQRLFTLLDEIAEVPITWVSAQAGSGKTTLIGSYLQDRAIPALWYRVDEADGDVASLFYYMSQAARQLRKGRTRPLPLLTPDQRVGMFTFIRHYFESLFSRMPRPGALVFDNYQDAPADSEFHGIIKAGLALAPEGIRIFIASRKEPPAPFVTFKAGSMLAEVGWESVRFTVDEVGEMIRQRKRTAASEAMVRHVHAETQGWAVGIILMSEGNQRTAAEDIQSGQRSVFDYLAVEVFKGLDRRTRDFLLQTSLLPAVLPQVAAQLTGIMESASILAQLCQGNYFTERYGAEYSYHPLFKEFLLDQAKKVYSRDELASLTVRAGRHLADSGKTEEAVRILLDLGAHAEALPLILGQAQQLLAQGRNATLEEWAAMLPENIKDTTPWLYYWLGMGRLVVDPAGSHAFLEKAFKVFGSLSDQAGCLLTVAPIIHSIMLQWDDCKPLDPWIDWIDRNLDPATPLPSPQLEAHISAAMVCALTWRRPWHPNIGAWIRRAVEASRQVDDDQTRCTAKGHVMEYYGLLGHWPEMRIVAEEFRRISFSPDASPLVHLAYMVRIIETHDFVHGSWEETSNRLQKAIGLASELGADLHLGILYTHGSIVALETDNLKLAEDFLGKARETILTTKRTVRLLYHNFHAICRIQRGDIISAYEDADSAVTSAVEAGVPIMEAYSRVVLAYVLRRLRKREDAWAHLNRAGEILAPLGLTHTLYLARLTRASLLFDEGDRVAGRDELTDAFRIGREKGYSITLYWFWQPDEMARLCAEALAAGVETEYAREVIKKTRLVPAGLPENLPQWPYPVRIHTLGRLLIRVNNSEVEFARKVQRRPLALLYALISLGGKEVSESVLEDLLWPEADGDSARTTFKVNLARLRRLLGNDEAVRLRDGRLSLDGNLVWLDTWALESLARRVSDLREHRGEDVVHEATEIASTIFEVYGGDFLTLCDEQYVRSFGERLRKKFRKAVKELSDVLKETGEEESARALADRLAEIR